MELREAALEAQAHYSLGQTYTLLLEPRAALAEHVAHREIAARLGDRVGLLRASACLASLYLGAHSPSPSPSPSPPAASLPTRSSALFARASLTAPLARAALAEPQSLRQWRSPPRMTCSLSILLSSRCRCPCLPLPRSHTRALSQSRTWRSSCPT